MPYTSIFSGGSITAPTVTKSSPLAVPFVPGQYAKVNAQIAASHVDPNTFKDVPALNTALKAGQINQSQWMSQFKTIQAKTNGPKVQTGLAQNLNPFNKQSVVYQQDVQPVAHTLGGAVTKAINQAKYLAGPTSTQQQRNSIITNQTAAAKNPEFTTAMKSVKPGQNSAAGLIQAEKLAAQGAKAPQIKTFLQQDAQGLNKQTKSGINTIATVSGFSAPGEGILAKSLTKAGITAAVGKDSAVNTLINSQRVANATKTSRLADVLGSSSVKEANTTHIPVREPTTTQIPVTGKSTQVAGKVTTSSDKAYITASNKLSAQYEKDMAKVQAVPHPVAQQVLQRQLDTKYNALQEKLDSSYGKSSIDFKGKPTVVKTNDTLPKSAMNQGPPTPFNSTRIAVQDHSPTPSTKSPAPAPSSVTEKPRATIPQQGSGTKSEQAVPGTKTSGSALRTEQAAVESGMKGELQGKAGYEGVSHKAEAADAVQLLHDNPQKAEDIAMGRVAGNNGSHEAAVYHAVANQALSEAKKTGDYSKVTELAASPRHTTVSETAQRLGAEGYNNPHDPVSIMADVTKTRQASLGKKAGTTVAKETADIGKQVKQSMPNISRQDWHSFVESLKC